jgi:hypothetical protein
MALTVKENGGGDFKGAPAGSHMARCIRLIDIGTQHGEYQGKATARKQVIIVWELPNELMEDGKPYVASKFYTASLGEKANLRKDLEAWRGRAFSDEDLAGFDLRNILGKPCMLSIVAKDDASTKTKVGGVMAAPKGTTLPVATNEVFAFDVDEWDQELFDKLSDGIKKLIQASDEYRARAVSRMTPETNGGSIADMEDSIPF